MKRMAKCFRSLFIHRLRTLLSTLGVLFGVAAVIAMLSIGEGAKRETLEHIEQLGMDSLIIRQPMDSEEQRAQALGQKSRGLSEGDAEALRQNIPGLARAVLLKEVDMTVAGTLTPLAPEILAVTPDFKEVKNLQLAEGRFLCPLDRKEKRRVCVLGDEVAKMLGKTGHAGQILRLGKTHYDIVGVLQSTYWREGKNHAFTARNLNKTIFISWGPKGELGHFDGPLGRLSEIILQIEKAERMDITAELVKNLLSRLHGGYEDYQIVIPQELFRQAHRTQHTFNWVLGSIAGMSLLVGGIGIMNIMLATVSERTREIGIRRAVGASPRHILVQFLSETLLLTLSGALLGVVVGVACSVAIGRLAAWNTMVAPWSVVLSLAISSLVGLCSGLYPALQAARMDPVKALRHEL